MGMMDNFLTYNKTFVAEKQYEKYQTSKYPDRNVAIVACMDTRLTELLPAALGIKDWLTGFSCVQEAVRKSVDLVRSHPLIPKDVVIEGFLMDPTTGEVNRIEV